MSNHLYTYSNPTRERDLDLIVSTLGNDGVIALPMDVSWAFCCDAASPKALSRIELLKPFHPKNRPYSLVCDSISMAAHVANVDNGVYRWLKKMMPGPYTVLLERHASLPKQIKDKRREVGIRIPDSELVLKLIAKFGRPIVATTVPANPASDQEYPSLPGFGWEVEQAWGHAIDMVIDLGCELPRTETTIVDLTEGQPVLIRLGAGDPKVLGLAAD